MSVQHGPPLTDDLLSNLNLPFTFGKYKGYTVGNVLEINPQWLIWANDNIQGFRLASNILEQAREMERILEEELSDDMYFGDKD